MIRDTDLAAQRGDFHFPISRAALCGEADCGTVFEVGVRSASDGAHRCPACGGSHFILIEAALSASGARIQKLENIIRWAAGEDAIEGVLPIRRVPNAAAMLLMAGITPKGGDRR